MMLEGHSCCEECDEGPHGCICGNDCAPPGWMRRADARDKAAESYPFDGTDPNSVLALRKAFRAGADWQADAAATYRSE